jgi:uncharacterized protein (UPF0332 family)/predicted nucleotidyltransferase
VSYVENIAEFKEALIRSDVGDRIAKVIWFGSTQKGEAREGSDVDLLIVTANGEDVRGRIFDLLLDFQISTGCPAEVVTSSIEELYPLMDYFLANVLAHGKEVYSMPEDALRRSAANHYWLLAQEYYDASRDSIERGHIRLGVDGAYNCAELAVKGLLLLKVADLPGSHGGVVQRFGDLFVKTGEVERALGRRLNQCLELRNAARYKHTTMLSDRDATLTLDLGKDIMAILEERLKEE